MSVIGPVQSHYHESSPLGKRSLFKGGRICWKGRFWAWSERVKKWWTMIVGMMTKMGWQADEVNRDKNGEADEVNLEVDSKDEVTDIWTSDLWFSRRWLAGEKEWQQMKSGYCEEVEER